MEEEGRDENGRKTGRDLQVHVEKIFTRVNGISEIPKTTGRISQRKTAL